MSAREHALRAALHARQPELLDFARRMIRTPSVNGVHDEAALAAVIAGEAARLGLYAQIAGAQPRRPNVLVSPHAAGETGLLLLGHLDTVPEGDPALWTHPPFAAEIAGGRLYGRGAADTKGGMAAALYALAALAAVPGALPHGRAQFIGVPDEETGATGTLGIRWLAEHDLLSAHGAIYAYAGEELIVGHRGLLRLRLTAQGSAIHTGAHAWQEREAGANAVTAMARLLLALEARSFARSTARFFEPFRTVVTPGTMIEGGTAVNIVPDHCHALVDIRTTPEHDAAALEAWVAAEAEAIAGARFSVERINFIPAVCAPPDAAVFRVLAQVTQAVRGAAPAWCAAGPANEGYLLIERGIPTVCGFGPVGANAHAVDEYVEIASLEQAALIYALTAARLSAEMSGGA